MSKHCESEASSETVSIVMATFNGEQYLTDQLESIANQSTLPDQLVIGDDGSSDSTLSIVSDFAARAPFRVDVHRNKHRLGYRANFMETARRAFGSIRMFCDQDDFWHEWKVQRVLRAFSETDALLVYHNALVTDINLMPQRQLQKSADYEVFMSRPLSHVDGFLQSYRSELHSFDHLWLGSTDPYAVKEKMAHDQWFFAIAKILGKITFLDENLALYRQHGQNAFGARLAQDDTARSPRLNLRANRDPEGAQALAAESHAELARHMGQHPDFHDALDLAEIADQYEAFAQRLRRWRRGMQSPTRMTRLTNVLLNFVTGAYSNEDPWRFATATAVGDFARAINARHVR